MDKKVYFKNKKGEKLAGILSMPKNKNPPLVMIVHGFGGFGFDKMFFPIVDALVKNGFAVFRFMFSGYKPSEGKFSDVTVEKEVEDLKEAYKFVKTLDVSSIGILAQSLGCYVSMLVNLPVKSYVFLAPAIDLKTVFIREFTRMNILDTLEENKPAKVESDYFIYPKFWSSSKKCRTPDLSKFNYPTLALYGDKDWRILPPEIKEFYKLLSEPKKLEIFKGGPHVFIREESYRKKAIALILDWFKKYLR